ncbi:BTAD domain-containing putative transcriptional regulator [Amycolatopsis sp. NPDC051071]|uniref:BTAD domain-containing putative transcriptional regulator n=1 Tax=Amycolatopsis sp. NPDC051071 TaxID=3154637 RepID=UPI003420C2DE
MNSVSLEQTGRRPRLTGLLRRDDLMAKAELVTSARVGLVIGPAGSGKSVLLRRLAAEAPAGRTILTYTPGEDPDVLLDALADGFVVHVDDLHRILGTPAERELTRLLAESPAGVRFVLAGRDERIAGLASSAPRVGYEDLRLRASEVEELFAEVYGVPLSPEEAAALCARIEGLAGAARLLHLDTVLMPSPDRAAAFAAPLAHSPRLAEFLSREVLAPLPVALREFMVAACPLGVLDGPLCDSALGRTGSHELIAELTARQALTFRVRNGGGAHRFHVLLQQHLEQLLLERSGNQLTRNAYRRAAAQLAEADRWAEAFRCHAHAGDWVAAAAVLHRSGARPGGTAPDSTLPTTLLEDDPWVALADARRLRGEGRLGAAHDRYADAETRLPDPALRWRCALERSGVARWLGHASQPLVDDINGHLADAVRRHPAKLLNRAVPTHSPGWALGRAVAALLDGRPETAIEIAVPLTDGPATFVTLGSRLLVAILEPIAGSVRLTDLATDCERAGWLWLARLARAATAVVDEDRRTDAAAIVDECRSVGDEWGAMLAGWLLAVGELRAEKDAVAALESAIPAARSLGARVPETWLRAMLVGELERKADPRAITERAVLHRSAADAVVQHAADRKNRLLAILRTRVAPRVAVVAPAPPAPVELRCLGRYTLTVAGTEIDLSGLRAQARQVFRMLTVHYGQPVHDERLMTALWPDCPVERTKHRLQVAVSSLRALLRERLPAGSGILRHGNAYLLRLPPGSVVDVVDFADAVRQWRVARQTCGAATVTLLGHRILDLYRGELLTEEGPAEWILAKREAIRGEAAGAAAALAVAALNRGDASEAIEICERGVTIDELDNRLWTLLATAKAHTGNHAAAARAERTYRALLA